MDVYLTHVGDAFNKNVQTDFVLNQMYWKMYYVTQIYIGKSHKILVLNWFY